MELSSSAAAEDDDLLLMLVPWLVFWVVAVTLVAVSLVVSARRCSRLLEQRRCRLRGNSSGHDDDDVVCSNHAGFDERSVKRLHRETYRDMTKEVNELRHIQAEVRSQLRTLKKVVEEMKEQRMPSVQGLSDKTD